MRCASLTMFCSSGGVIVGIDSNSSKCRLNPLTAAACTTAVQQSFPLCSRRAVGSKYAARSYTQLQRGHSTAHLAASWRANLTTTHSSTAATHRWDAMPLTAAHYTPAKGHAVRAQQHMPPGWGSSDASLVQSFQQLFQSEHHSAAGRQYNEQQQQQQPHRAASGSSAAAAQSKQHAPISTDTAGLHFSVVHPVEYGQYVRLVGSGKALGSWDAQCGPDMRWHEGHKWMADVQLAVGSYEFKFVTVHRSGEVEWEPGSNRVLQVPASAAEMQVQGKWGDTVETEVLEVQEHKNFAERRHLLQQLLDDAVTAAEVDASAASAAAAAQTLLSIFDFEQQQQQQRGTAVAGSQPTKEHSSASAKEPHQISSEQQQQQQPVGREAIPGSSSSSTTALTAAAADTADISAALVNTHEQLVSMLLEMRAELTSSISDVTAAIKEVQQELGQVQEQVAQLTAERLLQQHLQQQQRPGGAEAALLDATSSLDDQANTGFDAAVLGLQQQWLTAADNSSSSTGSGSSSSDGLRPNSGYTLKWKQSTGQTSQDEQQQQQSVAAPSSAPTAAAAAAESSYDLLPSESNSPHRQLATSPAAALIELTDLNSTVIAWRHEVLSFRQEAMLLRAEVAGLAETLELLEQQLVANTAALNSLRAIVEQQQQQEGREQQKHRAGDAGSSSSSATSAAPFSAAAAAVEKQLLAKFDQLASQLTAEVKNVVQSAVPQQQQIDLLQQLLQNEQLLNQLWTKPPSSDEHTEVQQQQQQHNYSTGSDMPSSSSSSNSDYDEAAAAAARLLGSNNVHQYHKGVLLCVMLAAGLWQEGLLDNIKGDAMRLTWRGYKACWGDELLTQLKHRLNSPQQLLAELQHSSSSIANTLACHVLWSLMDLSTHSTEVAALLQRCASISDMQLLGQLQPDAPHPGCAAVLRRWIAAAAAVAWEQ